MIISMYSCVQDIAQPESENIQILKTTIELDRFENELYLQVETNQQESQEFIKNVFVELTYKGDNIFEYSEEFQLYDNATNGDLIPSNGIYTLLTSADTVILPSVTPEIESITMEQNFKLDETNSDSLDISVTVYGKSFLITSSISDIFNITTQSSQYVNLDNSYIELMINTDYMFIDNPSTEECDRSYNDNPNPNSFESYFEWANGILLDSNTNQFIFSTQIPFRSLSDCGGTGRAIFRFILHDLDTNSEIVAEDIELI
ncbi:MAG TPA: hypothetical protein EYO19_06080, partial [Candidatus Marinimicrobia bacterium]|nr:hypothetical protein [Candidatus Neomarinimicrobiota bacterium]